MKKFITYDFGYETIKLDDDGNYDPEGDIVESSNCFLSFKKGKLDQNYFTYFDEGVEEGNINCRNYKDSKYGYRFVIVRDLGNEDEGVVERSWVYLNHDGSLPETTDDGFHKIPKYVSNKVNELRHLAEASAACLYENIRYSTKEMDKGPVSLSRDEFPFFS